MRFPGRVLVASLIGLLWAGRLFAAAPILYSNPAYQSPVRGEPDELLALAGYGFSKRDVIVYRMLSRDSEPLARPSVLPSVSNGDEGLASIVSASGIPNSIVIKLPAALKPGRPYALWVRNDAGEWSNRRAHQRCAATMVQSCDVVRIRAHRFVAPLSQGHRAQSAAHRRSTHARTPVRPGQLCPER